MNVRSWILTALALIGLQTCSAYPSQTLYIVAEASVDTVGVLGKLATDIDKIVASAQAKHPAFFNNYLLHGFKPNGDAIFSSEKFNQVSDLKVALFKLLSAAPSYPSSCDRPFLRVFTDVFNKYGSTNAQVLLISAGTQLNETHDPLLDATATWTLVPPTIDYISVANSCEKYAKADEFNNFLAAANGIRATVTEQNVVSFLSAFLPTRFFPRSLLAYKKAKCPSSSYATTVTVDSGLTEMYLAVSGSDFKPTLGGKPLDSSNLLYNDGGQELWRIGTKLPGNYNIRIPNVLMLNPCEVSIYGLGGREVRIGFLPYPSQDDVRFQAVAGINNTIVMSVLDGYGFPATANMSVVTTIIDTENGGTFMSSPITNRTNSPYNFVGNLFECPSNIVLTATVSGIDPYGNAFNREQKTFSRSPSTLAAFDAAQPLRGLL